MNFAYSPSNSGHGIRFAMITQRLSADSFPSKGSSNDSGSNGWLCVLRYLDMLPSRCRLMEPFFPFFLHFTSYLYAPIPGSISFSAKCSNFWLNYFKKSPFPVVKIWRRLNALSTTRIELLAIMAAAIAGFPTERL